MSIKYIKLMKKYHHIFPNKFLQSKDSNYILINLLDVLEMKNLKNNSVFFFKKSILLKFLKPYKNLKILKNHGSGLFVLVLIPENKTNKLQNYWNFVYSLDKFMSHSNYFVQGLLFNNFFLSLSDQSKLFLILKKQNWQLLIQKLLLPLVSFQFIFNYNYFLVKIIQSILLKFYYPIVLKANIV